ncbi:MAG: nucleotidyltransferase domain-containing protein [Nitrospinae bacterium]|nr:nucleotidyltransferase domain-containing protein [Nitrospinota bacterium]
MEKMSKEKVLQIVREMHAELDRIYGERLKGVYLYGSYARGEAREDGDTDVAVVLSGDVDSWLERKKNQQFCF